MTRVSAIDYYGGRAALEPGREYSWGLSLSLRRATSRRPGHSRSWVWGPRHGHGAAKKKKTAEAPTFHFTVADHTRITHTMLTRTFL
jgi:hypothetical protein